MWPLAVALAAAAAAAPVPREPTIAFPGAEWPRAASPAEQGFDPARLQAAFDYASGQADRSSYCASVHRNGVVVQEGYWNGFDANRPGIVWSVSKAVVNTLVAIAERDGLLTTEDLAARYITEFAGTASENVTIDMIMRHDSGRRYGGVFGDFVQPQLQQSQTEFAISLDQEHPIGTQYQYNQMGIQLLERILTVATGKPVNEYAREMLFAPIGFEAEAEFQEKSVGLPIGNDPLVYGGLRTTCTDLARFGTLWMARGIWNGERVFADDFFRRATTNAEPPRAGQTYHWSTGPENYRANGMGGQFILFNARLNLLITRIGEPTGVTFDPSTFIDLVMDALVDAEPAPSRAADNHPVELEAEMQAYLAAQGYNAVGDIVADPSGWGVAVVGV